MKQKNILLAISIVSALFVMLLFFMFDSIEDRRYKESLHHETLSQLSQVRAELEAGINDNFYLTRGLLAFVSVYPDMDQDTFHRVSDNLIRHHNYIVNIALAPDNILSFIHPIKGNEKALGLNYKNNAKQWPMVKKVIETGKTIIAGPVDLVQGGSAFISRTPVYIDSADPIRNKSYWGLASIVIDRDRLLESAGFFNPDLPIRIALRGIDGRGAQGGLIAGDETVWQEDPETLSVHLPEGSWQLAAVPPDGWKTSSPLRPWLLSCGGILVLATGLGIFNWLQKQVQTRGEIEAALQKAEQAETQLLFTNTILTSQMEASLDGVLVVGGEGEILSFNQRFVEIWQIPDAVLELKSDQAATEHILSKLVDPESFLAKIEHLYSSKEEKSREHIHLNTGQILDRYSTPLIGQDGTYFGRTWSFRDITEQTRMELELFKTKKLESIGVLAGGIAHDFNNLLAAILGNINLALLQLPPDEKVQPLLKAAEKASLRAKGLTHQLLTFSKGGEPVKQVLAIEDVIRESADFALRGTNSLCVWDFAENLSLVEIDPSQIGQAIQNIVLNAWHAMPKGGIIALSCQNIQAIQESEAQLAEGNYLKIEIKDSGVGIPADQIDKIFDPYHTTKKTGSGLGLAITHSIINQHNGIIRVASIVGQGTTFTLYLPATSDFTGSDQQNALPQIKKGSGTILIMDDDEMIRTMLQQMLENGGYQVLLAEDGNEAIEIYKKSTTPINAVIMDLTIPGGMGGKEAVKKLLSIDPVAKIIVSSGYSHDPIVANYKDYGFCNAIGKPYRWQELAVTLQQVLSENS